MTPDFTAHWGVLTWIPTARVMLLPTGVLAPDWAQIRLPLTPSKLPRQVKGKHIQKILSHWTGPQALTMLLGGSNRCPQLKRLTHSRRCLAEAPTP